ncbi:TKL family protein kinase [Histomonas meleagridis]|uniref:TKL family protein kinase n=1 Tax=Histomonas meleagridis TaxID=135588 RepID=UPI00355968A1|nr:TKL family protein kinase [Histomonas meleagridis]KAH0802708.1 TKL family protein kinase [Histomonas meleagridis]
MEIPKKINKKELLNLCDCLEQFQQLQSQCSRENSTQFVIMTSMRNVYQEFIQLRKSFKKAFEGIGFPKLGSIFDIPESDLSFQNEVDVKWISIIINQVKNRSDVSSRPDVKKRVEDRLISLESYGIYNSDSQYSDKIPILDLPPTLNFILKYEDIEFEEQIGFGRSGKVVRGRIKNTGQEVAVKILKTRELKASDLEMFRREVFTLSMLSHPSLVKFRGYTVEAPFCILTDYMVNGSLYNFLKERGEDLTPTDRSLIALDVALGLEYLHSRGIIHRDLKSLNVLLDEKKRAKICDFGLARTKSTVPMTGLVGTTLWMAPEVVLSNPFYDEKVDVYSFGILLWELLTGKRPYEGEDISSISVQVVEDGRRPIIPENTPEPLAKLMRQCWDQDNNKRPSFTKIVQLLQNAEYQFPGIDKKGIMIHSKF